MTRAAVQRRSCIAANSWPISYIDSEPFQEWLAAERDRTLALICDILQRLTAEQDAAGEPEAAIQSGRRLVALDPLSEFGQRALMRAYARAGRRGEALRQYKSCAETLKRELGVAPDAETQALANEIARSGGAGEANARSRACRERWDLAQGRLPRVPRRAGSSRPRCGSRQPSSSGTARLKWPCLLSSIAVAVAPLRNLTGDPEQQYLVEAFTDDLVTDLLRHGRGLSLKPIADERGILGNLARRGRAWLRIRRHRQRAAQRPRDVAGQHADHRRGDGRVPLGRSA